MIYLGKLNSKIDLGNKLNNATNSNFLIFLQPAKIFKTLTKLSRKINWFEISKVDDIKFQRYDDYKIRVCCVLLVRRLDLKRKDRITRLS